MNSFENSRVCEVMNALVTKGDAEGKSREESLREAFPYVVSLHCIGIAAILPHLPEEAGKILKASFEAMMAVGHPGMLTSPEFIKALLLVKADMEEASKGRKE